MRADAARSRAFKGIIASPGIAIGRAFVINKFHLCVMHRTIEQDEVGKEIERFNAALEATKEDMIKATEENLKKVGAKVSYILNPHIQLLSDPVLVNQTRDTIENEKVNAEWALQKTFQSFAARFQKIKDPYFKDRVYDIELVVNRVSQIMMGTQQESLTSLKTMSIVIAHDLTPVDTAQMASQSVLGFITEVGGKTSHAGIIASSLQIPAVVGVHHATQTVETGDTVILDAIDGRVIVNPTEKQFQFFNKKRQNFLYFEREMEREPSHRAATKDGVKIKLMVNVETSQDIETSVATGAQGIGLYRTEFLFLRANRFPSEEEQFKDYRKMAEAIAPHEAVIRTLDIGGDKVPLAFGEDPEINPALGLRAIRYCLNNPGVFRTQLRAILRASEFGKIKIMYPMIVSLEEFRKANRILERQKRQLRTEGIGFDQEIEIGMMIETPAAAIMAHQFAPHVDFFSIGTNDLIQYLLAIDRGNENVADLYEPLHPAVLRALSMVIEAANRHDVPVSICGQMGADPIYAYILLGMGELAALSMDVHSIPKIRKFVRNISVTQAKKDVAKIMKFSRVADVKKYLRDRVAPLLSEGMYSELTIENYGKGPLT